MYIENLDNFVEAAQQLFISSPGEVSEHYIEMDFLDFFSCLFGFLVILLLICFGEANLTWSFV